MRWPLWMSRFTNLICINYNQNNFISLTCTLVNFSHSFLSIFLSIIYITFLFSIYIHYTSAQPPPPPPPFSAIIAFDNTDMAVMVKVVYYTKFLTLSLTDCRSFLIDAWNHHYQLAASPEAGPSGHRFMTGNGYWWHEGTFVSPDLVLNYREMSRDEMDSKEKFAYAWENAILK